VEHEVKLAMDLGSDLPDLREVVTASVRQPEEHLRAVYFDTLDRRLWNRGIALRHRTGEGTPRWTLELSRPSSGPALVRTELEWAGDDKQIPAGALDVISGITRREPLQKVAELHTERIRFLFGMEAVPWAELANDVVTVLGGKVDGLRFRQLELEVLSGGPDREDDAKAIVKALRRAGARPDPHPKLEKVLGPPERKQKLGRKSSVEDLVRQALSVGLDRLLDHEYRIRAAGTDVHPEDVHQARVATRRLRSDIGTLKALLDPVWVGHVRGDLKWVANALGAVRDIDVLSKGLSESGAGDRLRGVLAGERAPAVQTLQKTLTEGRYLDLLDRLHAASVRPPLADRRLGDRKARKALPGLVKRRWKKLRRDVRRGGRRPGDDQLHRFRKESKQLRYACELATPVIGKAAKRTAKAAESLQTLLGDHHDAVVAREWLKRIGGSDGPASDVSALIEQEDRIRERLGRKWRSHYKKLAKRGSWL
jgi:CHAD domain-containing protein